MKIGLRPCPFFPLKSGGSQIYGFRGLTKGTGKIGKGASLNDWQTKVLISACFPCLQENLNFASSFLPWHPPKTTENWIGRFGGISRIVCNTGLGTACHGREEQLNSARRLPVHTWEQLCLLQINSLEELSKEHLSKHACNSRLGMYRIGSLA